MSSPTPSPDWLQHPLSEALLRLDRLPSLWVHPDRWAELLPDPVASMLHHATPGSPTWHLWHRHTSALLIRTLDLRPLRGFDAAGLPLVLLPTDRWNQWLLWAGATWAGASLRRVIARDAVLSLQAQLGPAFDFIRTSAATGLIPVEASLPDFEIDRAAVLCQDYGARLLARALQASDAAVAARGRLRLPPNVEVSTELAAQHALALGCELLEQMDSPWLSYFPPTHSSRLNTTS